MPETPLPEILGSELSTQMPQQFAKQALQALMTAAQIPSFRALSRAAGVTEWQVRLLRNGQAEQMRLEPLQKVSRALGISLAQLLTALLDEDQPLPARSPADVSDAKVVLLEREYERLQRQLEQQRQQLQAEFQQESLRILEPWMIHFPTAAYHAQQQPDLPATKLIPLVRPVEQLLKAWGVEAIAPIGTEIPYQPQWHQLREGEAEPGDLVCIRNAGYRQGEKLIHRAKVSPVL